jgi:hypothetical protein
MIVGSIFAKQAGKFYTNLQSPKVLLKFEQKPGKKTRKKQCFRQPTKLNQSSTVWQSNGNASTA